MSQDALYALIPIVSVAIGCPMVVLLGLLIFPSTRAAFARRLAGRGAGEADDRSLSLLESTNANVSALRSEVYALRCEVAVISRALPAATQAPADSAAGNGGR